MVHWVWLLLQKHQSFHTNSIHELRIPSTRGAWRSIYIQRNHICIYRKYVHDCISWGGPFEFILEQPMARSKRCEAARGIPYTLLKTSRAPLKSMMVVVEVCPHPQGTWLQCSFKYPQYHLLVSTLVEDSKMRGDVRLLSKINQNKAGCEVTLPAGAEGNRFSIHRFIQWINGATISGIHKSETTFIQ